MNYILFRFPGIQGVHCVFSGTEAGNISFETPGSPDEILNNRKQLLARFGLCGWQEIKQVHGDTIIFYPLAINLSTAGEIQADGQATSEPERPLLIKTADCQPIMLAHRSGKYIAALHVGWKGNRLNLPGKGVAAMCAQYGLDPADIMAVRGPSLGPKASIFSDFENEWGSGFANWYCRKDSTVNLWEMTTTQLLEAGVRPQHIFRIDLCTYSLPESFFSFRRDKDCGRQASFIWIENS